LARKVPIRILDDAWEASAEDSLLRALQMYGVDRRLPAYGFTRFCWNAKCQQCILEFVCEGAHQKDYACQTEVQPGLQICTLPDVLMWKKKVEPAPS